MDNIQIVPKTSETEKTIINIMNILSDYFSPETIEFAQEKIPNIAGFITKDTDITIGFITFEVIEGSRAKIYWMGVLPAYQHQGIGGILLKHTEETLIKQGIKEIELLTLDEHPDYPGYLFTREFYKKHNYLVKSSYMEDDVKILTMTKIIS